MLNVTLECDDDCFKFVLNLPNESREDDDGPSSYYSVSSVAAPGGRVYGVYLNGKEPELLALEADPDPDRVTAVATAIKVYDITDWPILKEAPATVTLQLTELEEPEDDDEDEQEGETIDVTPITTT